jgi:hypothetical protein
MLSTALMLYASLLCQSDNAEFQWHPREYYESPAIKAEDARRLDEVRRQDEVRTPQEQSFDKRAHWVSNVIIWGGVILMMIIAAGMKSMVRGFLFGFFFIIALMVVGTCIISSL